MVQPLEEQFQAEMGARLNPRQLPPEGNILPTGEQLRPSYTEALSSSLGGQVQGGQAVLDFFGGALGGLADTGKRLAQDLLPPYSLKQQSFDPWFNPEGTAATLGRGYVTGTTAGYGEGPWEQQRSPFDAALTMFDAFDPTNVMGDIAKPLFKSIPESTISAGFLSGWFKPKDIKKSTRNNLEDIWKHPIWTDNKWAPNPDPSEIRDIGARALYQDDVVNNIPGTTPQTYMQQGAGIGQTLEQRIASIGRGGDSPESLIKKSNRFNRMAADLRSGDDELMGNVEYWIDNRQDALAEYYDVDIWKENGEEIFRNNEEWAKEFDRISRDLTAESKSVEKWIADKANSIMDEEINIMERGMKEITGKGLPKGGSGTLPPKGIEGVLPSKKSTYKTDFVRPERVRNNHLTGWFDENVQVDIDDLKNLPGYKNEHTEMGSEYSQNLIAELTESMKKEGWSGESIMIFVERDGSVSIGEGNHRIRAALNAGLTEIPTEIKYFGNSNQNPNVWGRQYIDRYNPLD